MVINVTDIDFKEKIMVKNLKNCRRCGVCMSACPNNAIEINREVNKNAMGR